MAATHLHFDGYSGLSGDMILGAIVALGVPVEKIQAGLAGLPIGPFTLRAERVKRAGLMGTRVHVEVDEDDQEIQAHEHEHDHHSHTHENHRTHEHHTHADPSPSGPSRPSGPSVPADTHTHSHTHHHPHRRLADIFAIVEAAGLPPRVLERAKKAYRLLAAAEAEVHGATPETIHFHEVGAKDAIVDIAGAMLGIELLGAETFSAAPLTVGYGTVHCQHGQMPVPAPATAVLLRGMPTVPGRLEGEMVTPTGAAILGALLGGEGGRGFIRGERANELISEHVGYGAGGRVYEGHANYLRLWLCRPLGEDVRATLPVTSETVRMLECELDDLTPEEAGWAAERLMAAGALDAHWQPVVMKKGRPGLRLRVLAAEADEARLAELIFRETPTLGLRRSAVERWALERRAESVETPLGPVAVKVALWAGEVLKVSPEYEACAALARSRGLALAAVQQHAREAIARHYGPAAVGR